MAKFLGYIPGFRSNITWKKVVACIYYLFCVLMLAGGLPMFLFFLSIPFAVFNLIDVIRRKKANEPLKAPLSICLIATVLLFGSFTNVEAEPEATPTSSVQTSTTSSQAEGGVDTKKKNSDSDDSKEPPEVPGVTAPEVAGNLKIHFIDVGQADSILIQANNGKSMLVDAGNNADADTIISYIKKHNITSFDYVVGTHPHEDHIGSLDTVIDTFNVDKVIMPKVAHTTQTYLDALTAIKDKGLKITAPVPGTEYKLGDTKFAVLAPNSDNYEGLNDYSVVIKLTHGINSFLFTGDAETVSENEMLGKGHDLKADVLKVGHHGSDTSTTTQFLKAVSPTYAVISVGTGNSYGHPSPSVLNRLSATQIDIYRR